MNIDIITPEEKVAILKLREKIADILIPNSDYDDDYNLVKWLRARKLNIDQTEEMFRKHIAFMKANGCDRIRTDYKAKKVTDYFHTAKLGYDNEGSVVRIIHLGASDLRGLALSLSKTESFKFATHIINSDKDQQKIDREGKLLCDKQVYIFDLEGLNWTSVIHRAVVEYAFTLLQNYEKNLPESLKVAYVVHAPKFFNFTYAWLKTVLPGSILSKLEILPQGQEQKLPSIIRIDPSLLPASVGGAKTDEDGNPECPSIYKMPLRELVPENMQQCTQLTLLKNDLTADKAILECGKALKVEVQVNQSNSYIQWDFQTSSYDIGFGLYFKEKKDSEPSEIIALHRIESHKYPESGTFYCNSSGQYEIIFDNTYSWMTKKKLFYKIKVIPPNEIN